MTRIQKKTPSPTKKSHREVQAFKKLMAARDGDTAKKRAGAWQKASRRKFS